MAEMKKEISPGAVIAVGLGTLAVLAVAAVALAAPPTPQYACPICGQEFMTYEELYNHFTVEHPAEPIDIIWE
ncbi:unnamed protein product [marine sediment metagenome]|uniref:C2H2-type domain-containing protein n=1 Tax=marine sediment metagenome TaxID=412755 RepID=X1S675_9ZZZZ